jgi:hypothetical protein
LIDKVFNPLGSAVAHSEPYLSLTFGSPSRCDRKLSRRSPTPFSRINDRFTLKIEHLVCQRVTGNR